MRKIVLLSMVAAMTFPLLQAVPIPGKAKLPDSQVKHAGKFEVAPAVNLEAVKVGTASTAKQEVLLSKKLDEAAVAPKVSFEPENLQLFAGFSLSGFKFNSNISMISANAPFKFRNNTVDEATAWAWNADVRGGEAITSTDRDFVLNAKANEVYSNVTLRGTNETAVSDPFTWGVSLMANAEDQDVRDRAYTINEIYAGGYERMFLYSDDSKPIWSRLNNDGKLSFYTSWATPDKASNSMSKIYVYGGKPATPLYIEGITLPVVDGTFNEDFNLHLKIVKATRDLAEGSLTLGNVIAEADATSESVNAYYTGTSGLSAIEFTNLFVEDEENGRRNFDHLFLDEEFAIVIEGWDNGTFSAIPGCAQLYDDNAAISVWCEMTGEPDSQYAFTSWKTTFWVGFLGAAYGYMETEDDTDITLPSGGGSATIHVTAMYPGEVYMEDGFELPDWVNMRIENQLFNQDEYSFDIVVSAAATFEDRSGSFRLYQPGAYLDISVAQAGIEVSAANPFDVTDRIVNPSVNGQTGWTCERPFGGNGPMLNGSAFEYWAGNASSRQQASFDYWQNVEQLPMGVYQLSVEMGNSLNGEAGANEFVPTCGAYANDSYCFVDENAGDANGDKKPYTLLAVVGDDGKLRLGVKNLKTPIVARWFVADNFQLAYCGNASDAYEAMTLQLQQQSALDPLTVATRSLIAEYENLLADLLITCYDEYCEALAAIRAKKALLDANAALWKQYAGLVEQAKQIIGNPSFASVAGDLISAVGEAESAMVALELTSEQISAAMDALNELIEDVKSRVPNDTDVTNLLVNPDFAGGWTGWTHSGSGHGGAGGAVNANARCAEAWNSGNFDIHQDVSNAPVGVYEIQVQGFYRYLRGDDAWNAYFNEDGTKKTENVSSYITNTPARVYCNDNANGMANVFDYSVTREYAEEHWTRGNYYVEPCADPENPLPTDKCYPNNMTDAGEAFDQGFYKTSAFGLVARKGDALRVGMKGSTTQGNDSWAIFTRFKLVFRGTNPDYVKPFLVEKLDMVDIEKLAEKVGFAGQFVGTEVAENMAVLKAEGEAALADLDGEDMFEVLSKILAYSNAIESSMDLFRELHYGLTDLIAIAENAENAVPAVTAEANLFVESLQDELAAKTLTTDAAAEALKTIARLTTQLSWPSACENASDDYPVDMTSLLANPSFESGNTEGWTQTGTIVFSAQRNNSFGKWGTYYAENWHGAGILNMYQDVYIPAGYYKLYASAYCTMGEGVIYVGDNEVVISDTGSAVSPETVTVEFHVEDGNVPVTIGVKGALTSDSWICVDHFQLIYNGTEEPDVPATEYVVLPEGADVQTWYLNAGNAAINRAVSVAFVDNDVYVQGIFNPYPSIWVKGTIKGSKVIFKKYQLLDADYSVNGVRFVGFDFEMFAPVRSVATFSEDGKTLSFESDLVALDEYSRRSMSYLERLENVTISEEVEIIRRTVVDGEVYSNYNYVMVDELTYSRNFENTYWQALYVPFSIPVETLSDYGLEVAELNDTHMYDDDEDGVFEKTTIEFLRLKVGYTQANYPYMIRAAEPGEVTLGLTDLELYASFNNSIDCSTVKQRFTFTGTYQGLDGGAMYYSNFYALGEGRLARVSSSDVSLKPQRWYMSIENRDGSPVQYFAPSIHIVVDGEEEEPNVTAIEQLETGNSSVGYNLGGVRQQGKTDSSISIKNGRIVFEK